MKAETKQKLDGIVGKTFLVKDQVIKIKEWKEFASGTIVVIGDIKNWNLLPSELQAFFDSLNPVDPSYVAQEKDDEKIQFPKHAAQSLQVTEKNEPEEVAPNFKPEGVIIEGIPINTNVFNPVFESENIKANLMEMMRKVSSDPKAIPQAKTMVDIANSIVGIQKNQIQFAQILQKHQPQKS